jgi:hypothetical protein
MDLVTNLSIITAIFAIGQVPTLALLLLTHKRYHPMTELRAKQILANT